MKIHLSVESNIKINKLLHPVRSDTFWKYAAAEWYRLYEKYVPMKNGALYRQVTIEPKTITHTAPYAHYIYEGVAYGSNTPEYEGDTIVGYFSIPNRAKRPTGKMLKFNTQFHNKATRHWDKAAEPTEKAKLVRELEKYLKRYDF